MTEFFSGSALFAILLTFGAYEVGRLIQKKTGIAAFNPILIAAVLCGVVLVAATWMFPITGLVGGILCELCLRAGQFRQKGWLMLGFFCFNLGFIGDFLPLWFTKESYLEYAAQMMDAGYMATMEGLLTWPVFGVIVLSILVGSVLGSLLGMKLMRKHFVKAGLAQ